MTQASVSQSYWTLLSLFLLSRALLGMRSLYNHHLSHSLTLSSRRWDETQIC